MFSRFLMVFILSLAVASPGWAAGSSSDSAPTPRNTKYDTAEKAVKAGNYARAISLLQEVVAKNPGNADAWNYLGFSRRKLNDYKNSLIAYEKALSINPKHKGALEYLGELYIQTGNIEKARIQLKKLDDVCGFFGCEEYDELKAAIQAFQSRNKTG